MHDTQLVQVANRVRQLARPTPRDKIASNCIKLHAHLEQTCESHWTLLPIDQATGFFHVVC